MARAFRTWRRHVARATAALRRSLLKSRAEPGAGDDTHGGTGRFLMIRPLETSTPDKVIVVANWFEELKKSRK
jgi:hypothetical protein